MYKISYDRSVVREGTAGSLAGLRPLRKKPTPPKPWALMNRLIECVPNFSEGRDLTKVDAIAEAMSGIADAWILDRTSDADHNRSVVTLAGTPEAVAEAAIRGTGKSAELI